MIIIKLELILVTLLQECKSLGFTMMLFTANEGKALEKVKEDLKNRNIPYDLINENPLMNTRKPY